MIKLVCVRFEVNITMLVVRMKRKATRKDVSNARTRREFLIKRIKRGENFIESVIYVNDRAFNNFPLMVG